MKYINGKDIFPNELLEFIQNYAQGQYVYIPKRDESKDKWGAKTKYKKELEKRNDHIYEKYLTGFTNKQIAKNYHLSEKSIKRIITDKRKGAITMKETILEILGQWGIKSDIKQIYQSTWVVGDAYILKTNDNLANLKRNLDMMKVLDDYGIPVAKPIHTLDHQEFVTYNERYYLLMNKLSGTHVKDIYQADYINISYETGKIIAKLHKAFLECEKKITFWNNNMLNEMTGWVAKTLQANQYRYLSETDFSQSVKELKECYDKLPKQLIHRDFHYGNILFDKDVFSGYIDFDFSQKNIRIFDLCYFLMGLLVEHDKNVEDVKKWYQITTNVMKGYNDITPLTQLEKDSICCVMENIEMLFVAYFTGQEDEALAKGSADLYYFVKNNKDKICVSIV